MVSSLYKIYRLFQYQKPTLSLYTILIFLQGVLGENPSKKLSFSYL
ncbi:hypothetical protein BREVNS_0696 [Brevinematales bacterium NS]|nr:hypothetical protein BREVNS_0696 [Brevinematales bacterium NS]